MKSERVPHMPAKSMLSWRISRLRLDVDGVRWLATGSKGNRVAVIQLPELLHPDLEAAWISEIEERFEQHAFDSFSDEPASARADRVEAAAAAASNSRGGSGRTNVG